MSITEKEFDWEARARSLTAGAGLGLWTPEVRAWLAESGIKRVLVACSGGADSVFLLCQLCGLRAELGLEVVVGHYNHAWRGSASDEDVDFVEDLARGVRKRWMDLRRRARGLCVWNFYAARRGKAAVVRFFSGINGMTFWRPSYNVWREDPERKVWRLRAPYIFLRGMNPYICGLCST